MRTLTETTLVPYITLREGEDGVLLSSLRILQHWRTTEPYLGYVAEVDGDRDLRDVLWGRCTQNSRDGRGMPTGKPLWKLMHPSRQRECMEQMRCQVCAQPAKTPLGWIFLEGPDSEAAPSSLEVTAQPPVCAKHVRPAAALCPHLDARPRVYLVQRAPLYGVHGTIYGYGEGGIRVVDTPDAPLPYGHPNTATLLAAQMVRRLSAFRIVDMEELLENLQMPA
ncbi:hypothetical protein [Streptomyces sp. NPDC004528]|uniref:hypothetical protein n=1 Tax=Streptomyces sp. NPDC004528 TaxID=3154550 RepID=UPI0033BB1270